MFYFIVFIFIIDIINSDKAMENDDIKNIANRLKEFNPELYRLLYEISNSEKSVYDYILDVRDEILENNIARTFKTNEFICLFCDDYNIMILLIKNYCSVKNINTIKKYCSTFMDQNYKNHENFILHLAIYLEPEYFNDLPIKMRDDEQLMYFATQNNVKALFYFTSRIKNNTKIIMNLMEKNINCYEFAGNPIKQDIEISKLALKIDKNNIKYVSDNLFENVNFILYAYSLNCKGIYERIYNELSSDNIVIMNAIQNDDNVDMILLQNPNLRDDKELIKLAITHSSSPNILRYSSQNIKNNNEICSMAIVKNIESIKYLSTELKNNFNFIEDILCRIKFGLHEEMIYIFNKNKIYEKGEICEECDKNKEDDKLGCEICIDKLNFILRESKNDKVISVIKDSNSYSLYKNEYDKIFY